MCTCIYIYTCSYNISPHSRRVHSPHSNVLQPTPVPSPQPTPVPSLQKTPVPSPQPTPVPSLQKTPVLQPTPEEEHDFKTSGYSCGISSKIMTSLHCTHSQYYIYTCTFILYQLQPCMKSYVNWNYFIMSPHELRLPLRSGHLFCHIVYTYFIIGPDFSVLN